MPFIPQKNKAEIKLSLPHKNKEPDVLLYFKGAIFLFYMVVI